MIARCKRVGSWLAERLKDLWYGPGNSHLDSGRVVAWISLSVLIAGLIHNMRIHEPIDLGPAGLGGGLTAVLGALAVYLFKERQRTSETQTGDGS